MRLDVRISSGPQRGWIDNLLARIADIDGVVVSIDRGFAARARVQVPDVVLRVEGVLERQRLSGWSARTHARPIDPGVGHSHRRSDLIVDLVGDAVDGPDTRVWRLTFDGRAGDEALLAALIAGRTPVVALTESGRIVASARVGTDSHHNLITAFEDGLARTTTLILAALSGLTPVVATPDDPPAMDAIPLSIEDIPRHALTKVARKFRTHLRRLLFRNLHWRIGWRHLGTSDLIDQRDHPAAGWNAIPDDGSRFYADPFPIEHAGQTILFVEDFEYRRGKAIISAVAFGPEGPTGTPFPVLDEPYHLSYPFVFAREGEYWLVPESCANGTVDLYRATAFPGGWVKEATLLSGIVASDATLLEHDGRWWMFATVREGASGFVRRGAYSDALHVWSAPDFRGPWRPHAHNPVLIDIASARPAGRIVERGGALIRPVQDCRGGYGAALSLARIDRLDDAGFAQTVETTLRPGPLWAGTALHTLNRTDAFEFIDGCGRSPRFKRLARRA